MSLPRTWWIHPHVVMSNVKTRSCLTTKNSSFRGATSPTTSWKNPMMTMRGQNADGTSYETPDVPWSSFFNGGEALHGAYWRKTFGYAASHGCVNLPIPTAKWVYDWAPIGTPVVTHN